MSSDSQEIPPIRLDAELDRESARQIVEGVRDFAAELRTADECGLAPSKSETSKKLHVLVDQVLTLDLALPSGVKLGLLAIHGSHWKKPWENLKQSLSQWKPQSEGRYERIIPAFGDMDEPSGFLETEAERKQRLAQAKAERQALAKIASNLNRVLNMLTQLSQAAELRLLGKKALATPRKKSDAREHAEACLAKHCAKYAWMIDYLKERSMKGDVTAARLAKEWFGRNALAARLGLAQGTVSQSTVFANLKKELQLDEPYGVRLGHVSDSQMEMTAEKEFISGDIRLLLDRLDRCKDSKALTPELDIALRRQIHRNPDLHGKIEELLERLECGENPFS